MKRLAVSLLHRCQHRTTNATLARCIASFLAAVLASGCHSFGNRETPLPPNGLPPAQPSAKNESLPAAESAKLCLATASIMEQNEKHQEAIELYEKARQLDPRTAAQAARCLAFIHDRTGNFDKALDEYRRAIQENPKDAELFNNLGYGYCCRGEWDAAEKQLRKSVSLDPKLANAWTNLGVCLAVQTRYDESLAAFEKVMSKAQARCSLGFVQATQSKISEARRNYELALQLEPGLQMARIALQKLGQPNPVAAVQTNPSLVGLPRDELPYDGGAVQAPKKQ
jgi:tetratricopeptide (TPR) repeat protein